MSSDRRDRVLAKWVESGLSARAVAQVAGVSPWTLYAWRRQARKAAPAARRPVFVEVVAAAGDGTDRSEATTELRIELSRGITIRVERDGSTFITLLRPRKPIHG